MKTDKQPITGFKLTTRQRNGFEYDLTHGHPYRTPFEGEATSLDLLVTCLSQSVDIRQSKQCQEDFVDAFMAMSAQEPLSEEGRFVYPSASQSLLASAMIFASSIKPKNATNLRAQFISPVFDNIPGLFRSQGFHTSFTQEESNFWVRRNYRDDIQEFEDTLKQSDVLVLVTPNNPTGFQLGPSDLKAITQLCRGAKTALCIDRTFLNFPEGYAYDMHKILADSGATYTIVDDTGKLWASQELKLSILTTSPDLRDVATATHNMLQLTVSPAVMRALADLAMKGGCLKEIRELTRHNRTTLLDTIATSEVFESRSAQDPSSEISVERFRLRGFEADSVVHTLGNIGVGVIAMTNFHANIPSWAAGNLGMLPRLRYIRTALSRDTNYVVEAAERISQLKAQDCEPILNRLRP